MLSSQLITDSSAVAHWRFDASRGEAVADSQGNKDGRKTGFPSAVPGTVDNALNFDGVSSSVRGLINESIKVKQNNCFYKALSRPAFFIYGWGKYFILLSNIRVIL